MRYRVLLTPDENGTLIAEIPDVPGVITFGANEADALAMVRDALLTVLAHFMDEGRDIPAPREGAGAGVEMAVPAMPAVKLAIYQAMKDQGVSQVRLASMLGTDPRAVRRLLDLDHNSRWDHLERALNALGQEIVVDVRHKAA